MIYAETLGLCRIRGLVKLARFHRNQTAHQGRWAGPMPWNNAHTHTYIYIFIYLFILAEGLRFPGSRFRMLLSKYLHIPDGSDLHLGPNAIPHLMCPETRLFFTNPEIDMNLWMDMNTHHTVAQGLQTATSGNPKEQHLINNRIIRHIISSYQRIIYHRIWTIGHKSHQRLLYITI